MAPDPLTNASKRKKIPILALMPLVVFALLATLFLAQLLSGDDASEVPSALLNKPAPQFSLEPVEGLDVPGLTTDDLKGRVSVVNVFASWCVPCRQEHPLLERLAQNRRIQLFGINYKDKPENARRFLGTLGNPYARIGADSAGRAAIDWGVYGVPETFIVDAEGIIRYKFIGPLSPETYANIFLPKLEKILGRPTQE